MDRGGRWSPIVDDVTAIPSRPSIPLTLFATDATVTLNYVTHSRLDALVLAVLDAFSTGQPTQQMPAIGDRHGSGFGKPKKSPIGWHTAHGLSPAREQLPTRPAERSASPAPSRPPSVGPLAGATRHPLRGSATEWAPKPVLSARETLPHTSQKLRSTRPWNAESKTCHHFL